jgi:hypothetical protein
LRASLGWQSKSKSFNESEMALFFEYMPSCVRKALDTADIVRDGDVTSTEPCATLLPTCPVSAFIGS